MKRPSDKEIHKYYLEDVDKHVGQEDLFIAGIDYALAYNEERQDIMKIYDLKGFKIDVNEIHRLMMENEWDDLYGAGFKLNNVITVSNGIKIIYDLEYEHTIIPEGLTIHIDDKARVWTDLGDTPWEGSGAHDEIDYLLMNYLTKQRYG